VVTVHGVASLRRARIRPGDRWVFSAGFNVDPGLTSTGRIDEEVDDLRTMARLGARVAVLSHQGRHGDGSARHLDHVAAHLASRLGRHVGYFPENASPTAAHRARMLRAGEVVVFGNTRHHAGEERDDPALARAFARLGDRVAVGGFSKLHRAHASNVGILRHLPGCLASSVDRAVGALDGWTRPEGPSLAVLGGVKAEKAGIGLPHLVRRYARVVPAGTVLHAVLRARGVDIGDSSLGERPDAALAAARSVVTGPFADRLVLPAWLVVARADGTTRRIPTGAPVRAGERVVDFELPVAALGPFPGRTRVLIAGTPSAVHAGHRLAADAVERLCADPHADALLLGGDTVHDLADAPGRRSSGGGSALTVIATGSAAALDALRRHDRRTPPGRTRAP
jgi:phosphoglycerate kinase